MHRRRVTDAQLRDIVRARLTKGDAFRITDQHAYEARQNEVKERLASMTRDNIIATYSHHCYDIKS